MDRNDALVMIEETFPGESPAEYEERIAELQELADENEGVTLEGLLRAGLSMMTICKVTQDRKMSKDRYDKIFWNKEGAKA